MPDLNDPAYIEALADLADPDELWSLDVFARLALTGERRRQMDTAVALRRHASHVRQLGELLAAKRSLLITPLSSNGTAMRSVDTPADHAKLRRDDRG